MSDIKKICVVGTGYVGLVSGTCLAQIGHTVICVDNNKQKVESLKKGISPIYEPGLTEMMVKNTKAGRLSFTMDIAIAVKDCDIIFIAVNTPTKANGQTDLSYVETVSKQIALAMNGYKIIVNKSTVPVGTGQKVKEIITKFSKGMPFDVVSNPEFLREGTAISDFLYPDRIVVGAETDKAKKIMDGVYKPIKAPLVFTDIPSAEIIKHASNAYLATKISFINAVANICEGTGANVQQVALAMGLDPRIGKSFLGAGLGYGGSCLPKDVSSFINVAKKSGYTFNLLQEVEKINKKQRDIFVGKVKNKIASFKGKKIAVLGLSFKADTDDMRESPSIDIVNHFVKMGAKVSAFDPVAMEKAKAIFKDSITYCKDMYQAADGADALVIITDWKEFKAMDLEKIKKVMKKPIIVDGRNLFDPVKMAKLGFDYSSIGRPK
ncbi:MAG: UDP-glucose/GDP-mannose dehydrogenase family protein [Candidatus Staskawiczbacteria bacterium]|nr:UDP-glucose/GDP-mannose dehydrogenase family protein [Candidatus Staskawiczbacteria bacterium]